MSDGSSRMAPNLSIAALMTQLPPSPEIKLSSPGGPPIPEFSLNGTTSRAVLPIQRLRSVARYQAFSPQAMACSSTLSCPYDDRNISWKSSDTAPSCLGAVAGPQGVALFRLSRPHVPLLILSHATNAVSQNSMSNLAFEPKDTSRAVTNYLYLAATRGSGVLIWDASGHSPNPLVGRVGVDQALASGELDGTRLTSMCWKTSTVSRDPLLATTSASTICLWDFRSPSFDPITHFSTTRKATVPAIAGTSVAPLVQVACARGSEEIATIDAAGIVQIYDVRKNDRLRGSGTPLSTFAAHETAGVGISFFGTKSSSPDDNDSGCGGSRWLTWGLDEPLSAAVVKIWTRLYSPATAPTSIITSTSQDEDSSSNNNLRPPRPATMNSSYLNQDYFLTAQCVRPNLACARVCIPPIKDKFLAVGHLTAEPNWKAGNLPRVDGWWAELYSLSKDADDTADPNNLLSIRSFGLEKEAGFQGGDSTSTVDKRTLVSVLGSRTELGCLQAAELALASFPRDKGGEDSKRDDIELLLCCLSDTGVISTHAIPEAFPKTAPSKTHDPATGLNWSPSRSLAIRNNLIRTAFPPNNQARVYPEDREGASLSDAANFWGVSRAGVDSSVFHRVDERLLTVEPPLLSPTNHENDDPIGPPSRRSLAEGGAMPFDMEVPVAYGSVTAGNASKLQIGITDVSTGAIVTADSLGGVLEEGGPLSSDSIMQTKAVMDNNETERVPCPRLCGAVFGRGNGGLIVFHNGEVKKMWNWYQRTDTIRLATYNTGKADPILPERESTLRVHNATGSGSTHKLSDQEGELSKLTTTAKMWPRTLKELMSMMAAAKEAQWGEEATTDGSASEDVPSVWDNLFEDESLGSNSSDDNDDDDDDDDAIATPPLAEEMYKGNVQGSWKRHDLGHPSRSLPVAQSSTSPASPSRVSKKIQPFHGPLSDLLAPVVNLTRKFDLEMLGHQRIEFAQGWELGPWDVVQEEAFDEYPLTDELEGSKNDASGTVEFTSPNGLPHYRSFLKSPNREHSTPTFPILSRTRSDGNLEKKNKRSYNANATISQKTRESVKNVMTESGYRGENMVRPNMEESMKFFKKLFTQPQEEGGSAGFSTALSPPDRPRHLFTNHQPKDPSQSSTGHAFRNESSKRLRHDRAPVVKLGVFTLRLPKMCKDSDKTKNLDEIKRICEHNAAVCEHLGEKEKEGVWNLLAQTVDRQLDEGGKQLFNGWGGNGGGALGVELVGNLLKYFEARGDCQMLATMVCVLSGGRRSALRHAAQMSESEDRPYLLPLDQDEKYDMYIRRYADLLYEWSLLSMRAELNKHLIRVPVTDMDNSHTIAPSSGQQALGTDQNSDHRRPGIAVVFQCPKCGDDTEFNRNRCRKCRDFAFRCSICDNAVQGLFTVCDYCNHGGHVDHLTAWFSTNVECPTGCGCSCAFSPLTYSTKEGSTAAMAEENDALGDVEG